VQIDFPDVGLLRPLVLGRQRWVLNLEMSLVARQGTILDECVETFGDHVHLLTLAMLLPVAR